MPAKRARRDSSGGQIRRRQVKRYGWIPDLPDRRDRIYEAPLAALGPLPPRVDLRKTCPPVYNQGLLGSCTAHAIAGALEFDQMKQAQSDIFIPSRLFIYYNERVMEGTVDEDAGAMIRDGIKSVAKLGAPHEALWPYVIPKFRARPSKPSYTDALLHQAVLYQRLIPTRDQLRGCLADGYPFVFGFSVYENFESQAVTTTGRVPMPKPTERLLGGHAVLAVGYEEKVRRFIVRNSWGELWGRKGYFTMPYEFLLDPNLCDDFWKITLIE
ncbi:MAG: C1 family peptidase [Acidobacteria bacterium]|nr:C1 family peptidase [Acidobacteriota bacterium]MBI3262366.1 C1 family peptidase [Acidobacteriota bacterium]